MNKILILTATAVLLAACGSSNLPVSAKGSWNSVGKIHNGEIEVSYDTGSIVRQGNVVRLTDRKVIRDQQKMAFPQTPAYKAAITEWEFHCINRTNRPLNTRFYDTNGHLLSEQTFNSRIAPPTAIVPNMPSTELFNRACKRF